MVVDGWGLEQISQFLDRSYEASKEYVSQCRKRLADYLKPCLE
jgi:DNA-directed RNA polymerase specialized sigma24 family protein